MNRFTSNGNLNEKIDTKKRFRKEYDKFSNIMESMNMELDRLAVMPAEHNNFKRAWDTLNKIFKLHL